MAQKKYEVIGLEHPGRVNLPELGTVNLADLPENIKERLYLEGNPYLQPVPENFCVDNEPISISKTKTPRKGPGGSRRSRKKSGPK